MPDNTGGFAFPRPASTYGSWNRADQEGMTMLDWFAGLALEGMIAGWPYESGLQPLADDLARRAYIIAEEMIKARPQ